MCTSLGIKISPGKYKISGAFSVWIPQFAGGSARSFPGHFVCIMLEFLLILLSFSDMMISGKKYFLLGDDRGWTGGAYVIFPYDIRKEFGRGRVKVQAEKVNSMAMNIAICDDEEIFRTYLRNLLVKDSFACGQDIRVEEYALGEALLAAVEEESIRPDLIFLDIRMPGLDGLETARALRQKGEKSLIVFLSSLSEYARKGYEVKAFRYLLKEEADRELGKVMEECRKELGEDWFSFVQGHQIHRIPKDDILFFESQKRLILLHTARESYTFYRKLDMLEAELEGSGFLRCHRSYLVQERYVRRWKGNSLWLEDGTEVPVSRGFEKEVNRRLMLRKGE